MPNNMQDTTALTWVLLDRTHSLDYSVSSASSNDSLIGTTIPTNNVVYTPPRSHISRFIENKTMSRNINEKIR